ncbi:MAG: hypothetical protein M0Q92_01145 [Methanoregula sp.]|jgi:hypothetical protein|nr:hypothetical protein [Methanoregula sp.]
MPDSFVSGACAIAARICSANARTLGLSSETQFIAKCAQKYFKPGVGDRNEIFPDRAGLGELFQIRKKWKENHVLVQKSDYPDSVYFTGNIASKKEVFFGVDHL